ncbi:MAG: riboflavin synthase [Methylocystaceae bacterium]
MFTGLIEELGTVKAITQASQSGKITIACRKVLEGAGLGDSVAVNGVCLTMVKLGSGEFEADVMPETLKKSSLGILAPGSQVNLERALTLSSRLGGHLVQGHIDGVGSILEISQVGIAHIYRIQAPLELMRYIVAKGSIAIDGISLTVVDLQVDSFSVSLIPHTGQVTTLGFKKPGDRVNLETDILGRYVEKLLASQEQEASPGKTGGLTIDFLRHNGY